MSEVLPSISSARIIGISICCLLLAGISRAWGQSVLSGALQYRALVPELAINGARFRNVTTTTQDRNSRLGNELLKYGLVTVDYKNHKFYFAPFTSAGVNLQGENRRPLAPTITDGKLSVGIIWSKKLAQQITVGDQILRIDGVNGEQLSTCDITKRKYLEVRVGSQLKIKTKRGQIEEVVLAAE